ncbi:MAG: glycosyltransferase [Prevotella sp.]|nr:glycosyltransferase [Prevotella sp.]
MTVYIITKQPFPNGMAATNRIICYAKAIVSQGIDCKVLIFTRTEIYGKPPKNTKKKGIYEGVEYEYMGKTPLRSKNPFLRKINDWLDMASLILYLKKHLKRNDVVISFIGRDVKYINCIIRLTHFKKAKFVRELCELPYGTGKETPTTIKKKYYTLNKQFPMCDGIIAISDTLMTLAKKHASNNCHIIKIPILVDFDHYYLEDRSSEVTIPYIFHSGTLYEQKDGILGMLEAFGKATQKLENNIHFISTGTPNKSPHYHDIERIIKEYHLEDKVTFTGYLNNEQLKDYLSKASLVIINKYPNQQNTYCFSTKLGEYLAAGKPVIITKVGEAMNWLKDGDSAFIIEPNNTNILVNAIADAFNNSETRKRIGENGQRVCQTSFDYRQYGKELQHFFQTINQ